MQKLVIISTAVILLSLLHNSSCRQGYRDGDHFYYLNQQRRYRRQGPNQDGFPEVRPEWMGAWPNPRQMDDLKNAIVLALLDQVARSFQPTLPQLVEEYVTSKASSRAATGSEEAERGTEGSYNEAPKEVMYESPPPYPEVGHQSHYEYFADNPEEDPYYPHHYGEAYVEDRKPHKAKAELFQTVEKVVEKDKNDYGDLDDDNSNSAINLLSEESLLRIFIPVYWLVLHI